MKLEQLLKEVFQSPESAIEYLKNLALTGEIDKEMIDNMHQDLLSARRKMFTAKRTPDSYKAAAAKAKATIAQDKKRIAASIKKYDARKASEKASNEKRKSNNLLPLSISDYSGQPDSRYYEYDYDTQGGYSMYKLKDTWIDTPVSPRIAAQYWEK